MKILVLGGTQFLGRTFAETALEKGDKVTLLHRGKTGTELFPQARRLIGDRRDIDRLLPENETWDAVVDMSGYHPHIVEKSARALKNRVGLYTFISTISVYENLTPAPWGTMAIDESSATAKLTGVLPPHDTPIRGENYGALKRLCELEVEKVFGAKALLIRPGMIIGPHDHTNRFHWWIRNLMTESTVELPDDEMSPFQGIDARDLASWIRTLLETASPGLFNAVGPEYPATFNGVIRRAQTALRESHGKAAQLLSASPKALEGKNLPYWIPKEIAGIYQVSSTRSLASGLQLRALEETVLAIANELRQT